MFLEKKAYNEFSGILDMNFKVCPNQLPVPVFFYGERHIFSSFEFIVIGRSLDPREQKVIPNQLITFRYAISYFAKISKFEKIRCYEK